MESFSCKKCGTELEVYGKVPVQFDIDKVGDRNFVRVGLYKALDDGIDLEVDDVTCMVCGTEYRIVGDSDEYEIQVKSQPKFKYLVCGEDPEVLINKVCIAECDSLNDALEVVREWVDNGFRAVRLAKKIPLQITVELDG